MQIRPGGLAAFPVDVTVAAGGMAVEEEGLTVIAEVARDAKPSAQEVDELASFIRATVSAALCPSSNSGSIAFDQVNGYLNCIDCVPPWVSLLICNVLASSGSD